MGRQALRTLGAGPRAWEARVCEWVWAPEVGQRRTGTGGPLVPTRSADHSAKGPCNLGSVGLPAASAPPPEHPCAGDEASAAARVLRGGCRGEPRTHTRDPVSGLRGPAPGGGGRSGAGSAGAPPSAHALWPPSWLVVPQRPRNAGSPCFPRDGHSVPLSTEGSCPHCRVQFRPLSQNVLLGRICIPVQDPASVTCCIGLPLSAGTGPRPPFDLLALTLGTSPGRVLKSSAEGPFQSHGHSAAAPRPCGGGGVTGCPTWDPPRRPPAPAAATPRSSTPRRSTSGTTSSTRRCPR